jgi:hypothetical protein
VPRPLRSRRRLTAALLSRPCSSARSAPGSLINFINKIDQRHILKKEVEVIVSCSSSVGGWVVGYSILSLKAFAHQIISGRQSQAL